MAPYLSSAYLHTLRRLDPCFEARRNDLYYENNSFCMYFFMVPSKCTTCEKPVYLPQSHHLVCFRRLVWTSSDSIYGPGIHNRPKYQNKAAEDEFCSHQENSHQPIRRHFSLNCVERRKMLTSRRLQAFTTAFENVYGRYMLCWTCIFFAKSFRFPHSPTSHTHLVRLATTDAHTYQ
jgi:hypothetical protein